MVGNLLLLRAGEGALLLVERGVGDLQACHGGDGDVQDGQKQETDEETHEDSCGTWEGGKVSEWLYTVGVGRGKAERHTGREELVLVEQRAVDHGLVVRRVGAQVSLQIAVHDALVDRRLHLVLRLLELRGPDGRSGAGGRPRCRRRRVQHGVVLRGEHVEDGDQEVIVRRQILLFR